MDHDVSKLRASIAAVLLSVAVAPAGAVAQSLREQTLASPPHEDVFLQLQTPSVAEFNAAAYRIAGALPDGAAQKEHAQRILAEQRDFESQLAALGARKLFTQKVGANGIAVRVAGSQISSLRRLPGVKTVGRIEKHEINNATSVPWIGAPQVWEDYGLTGRGVKIGVIDTGVDYLHANFGGPGTAAAYETNDPDVIEPGTFPTHKVAGGYDFAGPDYNANIADSTPQPDPDPLDVGGHGSHVAGTIAGLGVPGVIGPGVAPGAQIYALKVFGDGGGTTNLTSLAIEWAMDPNGDGDMSDHLDVINMSLGSPFGDPADPSSISADNAAELGIIVVASAGNEGDTPYVTGAPAVASRAISVAANVPGGRKYAQFQATAPAELAGAYPAVEGAGPVRLEDAGPISDNLVVAEPADGCTALTNAAEVRDAVALVIRGACTFLAKYQQAQAAGARAIVVYNDGAAPDRINPFVMGGLDSTVTIPGLMISHTAGAQLAAATGVSVTLDAVLDPSLDDLVAGFSSRGPGQGGSTFKPDLSAPGVGIVSTGVGTGDGAANFQGTSMSAPHVAGAAALLREQHPRLDNGAIKALLQNSSVAPANGDRDVARIGVGAMRVADAAALTSYARPGGVSFGRVNTADSAYRVQKVKLVNLDRKSRSYTVQHVPGQTYPGVSVSCPDRVSVASRSANEFRIRLSFDPAAALAQGVFDDASISQTEVDGWCVLSDGDDVLRVAYLAVVDPASLMSATAQSRGAAMRVRNAGPTLGIAEGFTFLGGPSASSDDDDDEDDEDEALRPYAIKRTGFRAGDPAFYFGDPVLEFAIETQGGWEHISNLQFDLYLDTDNDGDEDVRLIAADRSWFQDVDPGQFVTAQFDIGGSGNLDWFVTGWDFNDRAAILPFTRVGGLFGRVPDKFSYRLVVTGRDGESDTQSGVVDFAAETRVDLNSFVLDPGGSVDVNVVAGQGRFLWLLPNNPPWSQGDVEYVRAPRR